MRCFNDFYLARLEGGIFFNNDYTFHDNINQHANLIQHKILSLKKYEDFKIEIKEGVLNIYNDNKTNNYVIIQDDRVVFRFGKTKIKDIIKPSKEFKTFFELIDINIKLIKQKFDPTFYGIQPSFVIPYLNDGYHNISNLCGLINNDFYKTNSFLKVDKIKDFQLVITLENNKTTDISMGITNGDNHIIIKTDVKKHTSIGSLQYSEFVISNLSTQFFKKLESLTKSSTDNYAHVDVEYLTLGVKS